MNIERNLQQPRSSAGGLLALLILTLVVLLTGACQPDEVIPPEPETPNEQVPAAMSILNPEAGFPDGSIIILELASTDEERRQGLMFRPSLDLNKGMLFVFDHEGLPGIWMKNTLISLDLLYLNSRGEIVDIIENAEPCKVEDCPTYQPTKPAIAVLELAAGVVEAHGLKAGDLLIFKHVPDYPALP